MEEKKLKIKNKKEAKKKMASSIKVPKKSTSKKEIRKIPKNKKIKKETSKKENIELKEKKIVKKVIKKKEKKTKKEGKTELILPKEWQKKVSKKKNNLKERLQDTMFEKLTVEEIVQKKERAKANFLKKGITLIIVIVSIILIFFVIDFISDGKGVLLNKYKEYNVGDKIILKDKSIWFVVSESDERNSKVILLKDKNIDINNDKKYDGNDKKAYNSDKKTLYDMKNKGSVAEFLEYTYKKELIKSIGDIKEVRLLKSKEFVNMRNRLNYPYEWKDENILAGNSLGVWWVEGGASNKVFAVTTRGAYKLFRPDDVNYIRPVIVIDKSLI